MTTLSHTYYNFYRLQVKPRYRDPQLQVIKKYVMLYLYKFNNDMRNSANLKLLLNLVASLASLF